MAVVSQGRLVGAARPPRGQRLMPLTLGQYRASHAKIFETQPAVRTVVGFLGRNIAQLGLHGFRMTPDGDDRKRMRTEPLGKLIRRPNPRLTQYEWINGMVCDLAIFDDHYSLKMRVRDDLFMVPIPVELVEPIGDNWLWPDGYRIGGGTGFEVPAESMVHIHGYHPSKRWNGLPPMEALRRILAGDNAAEDHRESFWTNGAQLSGVLTRPHEAGQWSDGARDRFLTQWRARYGRFGSEEGGTPLLEDGITYTPIGTNQKDSQYIESRKLTREEVAAVFYIPPPMIGILDNANYSNVKEFHTSLYQDTLGPTMELIQQSLWLQLIPDVGDPDTDYVEFNVMAKLSGTFEEQAQILSTATGGPWMTRAEARSRVNLPRIDDPAADELITPLNVLTGGQASPRDSAPPKAPMTTPRAPKALTKAADAKPLTVHTDPDAVSDAASVLGRTFDRQRKVVLGRLRDGKSLSGAKVAPADVFDADRWDRELAADLSKLGLDVALVEAVRVYAAAGLDVADASADPMRAYLEAKAKGEAEAINAATLELLAAALDDEDVEAAVEHLFGDTSRLDALALGFASSVIGFAATDTARAVGYGAKEWIVTSAKSRHPELNGERVAIDDVFSNGARWPGDSGAGVDEAAGCTCDLVIVQED